MDNTNWTWWFFWEGGVRAWWFFGGPGEGLKCRRMDPGGMGSRCDRDALYEIPK